MKTFYTISTPTNYKREPPKRGEQHSQKTKKNSDSKKTRPNWESSPKQAQKMKSHLVEHRLKQCLGITDPRQKIAQVGKSTPHPGKKILQGKSTTLAGHHHSKHQKKCPGGEKHPPPRQKFLQGKSTTLAGHHHSKHQTNKTKTAQAGFEHP